MKVLFVNAFKTKNPFNWIVALWTGGKYSHCEFLFDDGYSFGASFTEGKCRWARPFLNKDEYEVFEIDNDVELDGLDLNLNVRIDCRRFNDKPYDYTGLMGFVFRTDDFESKKKYFCSELMTYILQENSAWTGSKEPCRMSPNRLFKDLKRILK